MWSTILAAAIGAFFANAISEVIKARVRAAQQSEEIRNFDHAAILRVLEEAQDLTIKYWAQGASALGVDEPVLRAKIMAKQQEVANVYARLFTGEAKQECDVAFVEVIKSFSDDDFGPEARAQPERAMRIYSSVQSFSNLVTSQRRGLSRPWLA